VIKTLLHFVLFLYSTNGSGAFVMLTFIEFVQKVSQYTIILASVFLLFG
jgi:hypothetical protein